MRRYSTWRNAAVAVLILGISFYWYFQQQKITELQHQINQVPDGKDKALLVRDRIALENTIATSVIQAVGGLLLFVTAYVSLQNLKATQQNVAIAQRNLLMTEEKQLTERFVQSINQLGSDKTEIRLGGIYALERIAKDSPKDHWTVMEVLTSFIQERSPLPESALTDLLTPTRTLSSMKHPEVIGNYIQAALTVIGRRNTQNDPQDVKQKINLSNSLLTLVDLDETNFSEAYFIATDLRKSSLMFAVLREATFTRANLSESLLIQADLRKANLNSAWLIRANLLEANLSGANLTTSNLCGAYFKGANLSGVDFKGADLSGANLCAAKGLDPQQIRAAKHWEKATYDEDFRQHLGLPPQS